LTFRDLDGKTVALTDFQGGNTLVLFWNPSCGFCQQMLGSLKAWEVDRPSGAPMLLVISTGTAAKNRAMNLRSPVVFDHDLQAGTAFGANGTPMAVLIDATGKIASELAAGSQAVMALTSAQSQHTEPSDRASGRLGATA
jgi:protein-disulfide isomerase